jgi:DNA processing protein
MDRLDLIALSLTPAPRPRLLAAARFADHLDRHLTTALAALGDPPTVDPETLRSDAARLLETAGVAGLRPVIDGDAEMPALLSAIPDPPLLLWVRGSPTALTRPAVAIVGSRNASHGALDVARRLGRDLASAGLAVISGLARGCDGAAHEGALSAGGCTIAVLGSGADVIYPAEHRDLAARIAATGALLSEFPPGTLPLAHHFPLRNRIISGLSRAVIVVEAGGKSGSLITAACALEQGRDVMVVPGPVLAGRNRGGHLLIRDGAALVETAEDVLDLLLASASLGAHVSASVTARDREVSTDGDPAHADPLLAALALDEAQDVDQLAARSGLPATAVLAQLSTLELSGQAARHPGGRFVRLRRKVIT